MKFKLDENLDVRLVEVFQASGDQAETVLGQKLSGSADEAIYNHCRDQSHILVTLDLDFSNPLRFPPASTPGIFILRPPAPTLPLIRQLIDSAIRFAKANEVAGRLCIIEPGRVRVYSNSSEG